MRNIGIVAHIDAGKTSVTESFLYLSGTKHYQGNINDGNTLTDYDPEEIKRGITINSALVSFDWKDQKINLIDTPGHIDFFTEVQRSLKVLDGLVFIIDLISGIKSQTKKVWIEAQKYNIPTIIFINKLDYRARDYQDLLEKIKKEFNLDTACIQLPQFEDDKFIKVIDNFDNEELIDCLSKHDDQILEVCLEGKPSEEQIKESIKKTTQQAKFIPILLGSALKSIGITELLDGIIAYLPAPKKIEDSQFSAYVYKIRVDQTKVISYLRIFSGKLKKNAVIINARTKKKIRLKQLWNVKADQLIGIEEASAGEIIAVTGIKEFQTGDTIYQNRFAEFEVPKFSETVIQRVIETRNEKEKKEILELLEMISLEDPAFKFHENNLGQITIAGIGELHLEIITNRLKDISKINFKCGQPEVEYKEKLSEKRTITYHLDRELGLKHYKADIVLEVNHADQTTLTHEIEKRETTFLQLFYNLTQQKFNGFNGYELVNTEITILDYQLYPELGNELALSMAFNFALEDALRGNTILLEPYARLEIEIEETYFGKVQHLLMQKNAEIQETEIDKITKIDCFIPIESSFNLATELRTISAGNCDFRLGFSHFQQKGIG